jgi:hypothetical protein
MRENESTRFANIQAERFKAGWRENKDALKFANDRNISGPLSGLDMLFGG